jgi:hypothetical protein
MKKITMKKDNHMTDNSSNETNAGNTVSDIDQVITIVDSLSIPGSDYVLKPLSAILGLFAPDPMEKIEDDLKRANDKLDNMYNVVLSTLRIWDLQQKVDSVTVSLSTLMIYLGDDKWTEDRHDLDSEKISGIAENLYKDAYSAILEGGRLLEGFEAATLTRKGSLLSYIGDFVSCIYLPYQCVALAQHGYNLIIDHFQELINRKVQLTVSDKKCLEHTKSYSSNILSATKDFFQTKIPQSYPKWCEPVFTGKPMMLVGYKKEHNKNGDREALYISSEPSYYYNEHNIMLSSNFKSTVVKNPEYSICKFKLIMVEKPKYSNNTNQRWAMIPVDRISGKEYPALFVLDPTSNKEKLNFVFIYEIFGGIMPSSRVKQSAFNIEYDGTLIRIVPLTFFQNDSLNYTRMSDYQQLTAVRPTKEGGLNQFVIEQES